MCGLYTNNKLTWNSCNITRAISKQGKCMGEQSCVLKFHNVISIKLPCIYIQSHSSILITVLVIY